MNARLQDPPQLRGPTVEILGIGEEEAAGDIVLSSVGKYLLHVYIMSLIGYFLSRLG